MTGDPYHGRPADPAAYFSDCTDLYERYRPSYPHDAIDTIVRDLPKGAVIADIGCGTGICSRQLAAAGCRVIGIEPNDDMLAIARLQAAQSPHAERMTFQPGTGEATGLNAESVDAVVCAQSFHWFDADAALREFARILKPSGRLALMWNKVARSDPFSAGYRTIMNEAGMLARARGRLLRRNTGGAILRSSLFTVTIDRSFPNAQQLDLDGLLGRARSASYFPSVGVEREHFESKLRGLFAACATDGDNAAQLVTLRYETHLILAQPANDT
jgi:SAM-dependent methyltransferase